LAEKFVRKQEATQHVNAEVTRPADQQVSESSHKNIEQPKASEKSKGIER
jgi:hypothetical protein